MQRNFSLIHNDLHGNNVMYVPTTKEYFYYSCSGITYKVPTYGYLLKIIDFDRGIGYIKLHGMKESKLFMSDQFDINDEAGGQYNFQPFFKDSVPIIKPNLSFDLVRFATSMFWDLYPEGPESLNYKDDKLFKIKLYYCTVIIFNYKGIIKSSDLFQFFPLDYIFRKLRNKSISVFANNYRTGS